MSDEHIGVVWKYRFDLRDMTWALPHGAVPLHFGLDEDEDDSELYIWIYVMPARSTTPRRFVYIGTGQAAPMGITGFVRSATGANGAMWHCFECEASNAA